MRIHTRSSTFTFVLGLLAALPALSIDISAPSLISISRDLGISSAAAGLTISLFLIGFAAGQLIGGTSSDRLGRRPVLIGSLLCFTFSAAGCMAAGDADQLFVFRVLQGVGAGSCSVIAFAIIQDLFRGDEARSKRSFVAVVFGTMPMFAPALGVLLLELGGWRAINGVLALGGTVLLAVSVAGIAETKAVARAIPRSSARSASTTTLSKDRKFLSITAINAISYGGLFSYIAGSSIVLIEHLGFSGAEYAGFFATTAGALAFGAWVSGRLARRHVAVERLLDLAFAGSAVVSIAALTLSAGSAEPVFYVPGLLIMFFCRGILAPNLLHLAIGARTSDAGAASAVIGVLQLVLGAITSAVVAGMIPDWGIQGVVLVAAICTASSAAMWFGLALLRRSPALNADLRQ